MEVSVQPESLFQRWAALIYIALITVAEFGFIYLYCRWHGIAVSLLHPWQIYEPENIKLLSQITFVGDPKLPPTTMSFTAEVLMWSSLGVWGQRIFGMAMRYQHQRSNFPYDVALYVGILARNTSIAAIILVLLNLSKFSVFGVSLDRFDAVAGLAFMLGYFGEDSARLLRKLRQIILGEAGNDNFEPSKGKAPSDSPQL